MAGIIERGVQTALQLEEKGQIREAYFTFITSSQSALTSLQEIKFIRSSIVTSPRDYPVLLDSLKTCLEHIESIIETHSPVIQRAPPPLPPKPSRIQKPAVPPRPPPPVPPVVRQQQQQQQQQQHVELQDNSSSSHQSEQQQPQRLPSISINVAPLPSVIPAPAPDPTINTQPQQSQQQHQLSQQGNSIVSVVAEGQVDPNYLVPAQTHVGDSLSVPASNHHQSFTDHIPLIPTPPLLTTHRQLQQKLSDFEEKVQQCKAQKNNIRDGISNTDNTMTEEELDQMISHYIQVIAEIRTTLNGVRTIYMSAATIPTVLQFQPVVIAYQVTLIEASIFNAIPPLALLKHSSKRPHPRIVASTDFFNYITRCIEHSILLPQEASARAQLVHYWIKVASKCLEINNYQTLKAIVSALNTPPIQRLKRTWAYVPRKSAAKLETLDHLMSESDNYRNYRENLGTENSVQLQEHFAKPTVPFLGTFIHDITYLLAAYQKSPGNYPQAQDEPRIQTVLNTMSRFQQGPRYTPFLPSSLFQKTHHLKPSISSAFQKGASRIQRISGTFGFENSNGSSSDTDGAEDDDIEEQQKMATQYILMRPWVSQNTVDELSQLREPSQPKITNNNSSSGGNISGRLSSSNNRSSSMLSNSSSIRLSNGSTSTSTSLGNNSRGSSRPTSMDDEDQTKSSFWPFNRRSDRPVTIHEGVEHKPDIPPRPVTTTDDELRLALANRLARVHDKNQ